MPAFPTNPLLHYHVVYDHVRRAAHKCLKHAQKDQKQMSSSFNSVSESRHLRFFAAIMITIVHSGCFSVTMTTIVAACCKHAF